MIKVLFVCKGNICRSPLAQGIFDSIVKEQGLDKKLCSDSAGTSNSHTANTPDPRSIQVAKINGIKLNHQARQIRIKDFEDYDYLIPMDLMNQTNLIHFKAESMSPICKIIMMRKFDPAGETIEVMDPYYGDLDAFSEVYRILYRSIVYFIEYLKVEHSL